MKMNKYFLLLFLHFSFIIPLIKSQISCNDAPTPSTKIICEQLHRWDKNVREAPPEQINIALPPAIPGLAMPKMAAELAPIASTPYQCMDLGCLCSYMGGNGHQGSNTCTLPNGQPLRKALRKEYRMLSDDERDRFHAALLQIKNSGEYDRLTSIHSQFANSGSAHSGPAFLPWHREYIKRIEIALRQVDPTLALPYWDSTLDSHLPSPRDSIIWSQEFMGSTDQSGNVISGPFARWRTISGRPNIVRRVGSQGTVFQDSEINYVMQQVQIENILAFTAPRQGCVIRTSWNVLEYTHGNVHIFVGGDMLDQSTSANDPIFFLHHSFVDMVWEMWRQARQSRFDRENAYPLDMQLCSSTMHFGSSLMRPFEPWRNVDGLNNKYTDNMYQYQPRPTCSASNPSCGSKYLFCDLSHSAPRCASKARIGGMCSGFRAGEEVCYGGICQGGRCVASNQITTRRPPTTPITLPSKISETCFNEHECCATWSSKGECQRNPGYMSTWCKASCGRCKPSYDLNIECNDRHSNCITWSLNGECTKNPYWMSENCRKSCKKCSMSRSRSCGNGGNSGNRISSSGGNDMGNGGSRGLITTTRVPAKTITQKCDSTGCFNENICCQFWGLSGQCARNADLMSCNCRVSCGYCIPQDYAYGTCDDYHHDCQRWATRGECQRNGWMLENCRLSCQTCLSGFELRRMCRSSGRNMMPQQFQQMPFDRRRRRIMRSTYNIHNSSYILESKGIPTFSSDSPFFH